MQQEIDIPIPPATALLPPSLEALKRTVAEALLQQEEDKRKKHADIRQRSLEALRAAVREDLGQELFDLLDWSVNERFSHQTTQVDLALTLPGHWPILARYLGGALTDRTISWRRETWNGLVVWDPLGDGRREGLWRIKHPACPRIVATIGVALYYAEHTEADVRYLESPVHPMDEVPF